MNLKIFCLLFFVAVLSPVDAQIDIKVKTIVDNYPTKIEGSGVFAGMLNSSFEEDLDKVEAIYYWIAKNVSFDTEKFISDKKRYKYSFRYKTEEEKQRKILKVDIGIAEDAFVKRKAVCNGYAYLFKKLCNNVGVQCEVVQGTSKNGAKSIGRKPGRVDHSWNVVKINDKWDLVDVTWGAGFVDGEKEKFIKEYNEVYFLTNPEDFFLTHYPKKKEWLLVDKSKEDFADLPLFHTKYFNSNFEAEPSQNGIINKAFKDTVRVKINLKSEVAYSDVHYVFGYSFQKDKKLVAFKPLKQGNQLLFDIPTANKKYDYLTILCNNEALVTYKLKLSGN